MYNVHNAITSYRPCCPRARLSTLCCVAVSVMSTHPQRCSTGGITNPFLAHWEQSMDKWQWWRWGGDAPHFRNWSLWCFCLAKWKSLKPFVSLTFLFLNKKIKPQFKFCWGFSVHWLNRFKAPLELNAMAHPLSAHERTAMLCHSSGNSSGTAPSHALPFSPAPPTTPLKQPNYHIPFCLEPIFRGTPWNEGRRYTGEKESGLRQAVHLIGHINQTSFTFYFIWSTAVYYY